MRSLHIRAVYGNPPGQLRHRPQSQFKPLRHMITRRRHTEHHKLNSSYRPDDQPGSRPLSELIFESTDDPVVAGSNSQQTDATAKAGRPPAAGSPSQTKTPSTRSEIKDALQRFRDAALKRSSMREPRARKNDRTLRRGREQPVSPGSPRQREDRQRPQTQRDRPPPQVKGQEYENSSDGPSTAGNAEALPGQGWGSRRPETTVDDALSRFRAAATATSQRWCRSVEPQPCTNFALLVHCFSGSGRGEGREGLFCGLPSDSHRNAGQGA